MKPAGGLEAHIRQVAADYEWLVDLATERLNQYARLTGEGVGFEPFRVTTIEGGFVFGERVRHGSVDSLSIPLAYLWAADLPAQVEKQRVEQAALEAAEQAIREEQLANEKAERDRYLWQQLLQEYGPGGPP